MPEKNKNDIKDNGSLKKNIKKKKSRKIKKRTIKKICTIIVLIAILTVILYFAFKTLKPQKVIATVNDEIITEQELKQKYNQLPDQYKLFITKDDFLDQIINVKLLLQKAKKQAIVVSEDEIEEELNNLKEQVPAEEAFEQLLKQRGIKLDELRNQISEQLAINKLLDETVFSKIEISDSKIRAYYNDNEDYFKENKITYKEAKEQISQILTNEISNNAIEIYINQLRSGATITKDGVKITSKIETFTKTEDPICKENNKLVIRLFSTTKNSASKWISETFDNVVGEYADDIVAYHWQLDTGDNTLTDVKEQGIPKKELEIFQKYNPKSTVPTYIFGCKYARVGNAYQTLEEEKAEFSRVIEKLIG